MAWRHFSRADVGDAINRRGSVEEAAENCAAEQRAADKHDKADNTRQQQHIERAPRHDFPSRDPHQRRYTNFRRARYGIQSYLDLFQLSWPVLRITWAGDDGVEPPTLSVQTIASYRPAARQWRQIAMAILRAS